MTEPVFVDANVFLYMHDPAEPSKQARAADWIGHLWQEWSGRTSVQVLSEMYAVLTRKFHIPAYNAWEDVSALFAWKPQVIDEGLMARAREIEQRYRISWWDSMVVAAAQIQECTILLTEDLQDGGVFGHVTVRNPFTTAVKEPAVAYVVARPTPLHRPRGRPRRAATL